MPSIDERDNRETQAGTPNGEEVVEEEKLEDFEKVLIRPKSHGPLFRSLGLKTQQMIKKIHQNLGHPDSRTLQIVLSNDMDGQRRMFREVHIFSVQYAPGETTAESFSPRTIVNAERFQ